MRVSIAALNGRGLGLGPEDSCYDPAHPWYMPNAFNDSVECACIADQGRPCAEQCVGYMPGCSVAATMGDNAASVASTVTAPVGTVAAGVVSGTAAGLANGLAEQIGAATGTGSSVGMLILAGAAVLAATLLFNTLGGKR